MKEEDGKKEEEEEEEEDEQVRGGFRLPFSGLGECFGIQSRLE